MGEGTTRIGTRPPEQLEREIETLRGNLDAIVKELDFRRHKLLDWRLQLQRHATAIWIGAGVLGGVAGGMIILSSWRGRRGERPIAKVRRLRRALARMVDEPEKLARPTRHTGKKVATAGAVVLLAKAITQRVLSRRRSLRSTQRRATIAGDGKARQQTLQGPAIGVAAERPSS